MSPEERQSAESVVTHNLEQLLYAITTEPRLFRWKGGRIQWSPHLPEPTWQELPLKSGTLNDGDDHA